MVYNILKDKKVINTIVADETFVSAYCEKNGYAYEIVKAHETETTSPVRQREEAYNTMAIISFGGDMLTVTQAAQQWQYYAAEGNTAKMDELTAMIAKAKASIRAQHPDEEE